MSYIKPTSNARIIMGKIPHGADLLEALTEICVEEGIKLGRIEAIGAVKRARISFYDQAEREYRFIDLDSPMEITNLTGNVSLRDGAPFVHAHITLADEEGRWFGGHLAAGTEVFACELALHILDGPDLARRFDAETGLPLWDL